MAEPLAINISFSRELCYSNDGNVFPWLGFFDQEYVMLHPMYDMNPLLRRQDERKEAQLIFKPMTS